MFKTNPCPCPSPCPLECVSRETFRGLPLLSFGTCFRCPWGQVALVPGDIRRQPGLELGQVGGGGTSSWLCFLMRPHSVRQTLIQLPERRHASSAFSATTG